MRKELFNDLRNRWKALLIGTATGTGDKDVQKKISGLVEKASKLWKDFHNKTHRGDSAYLWADLKSTAQSSEIAEGYKRLREMALALQTPSQANPLHQNENLKTDIIDGLNWMYANRYYIRQPYNNWFEWEIGAPLALNDIMVLLHEDLTPKQIKDWTAVIDHFCPNNGGDDSDYKYWGANRAWRATVHAVGSTVENNAKKLALARDGLSDVSDGHTGKRSLFKYVTTGDGFYQDGSFIQHFAVAYTGGYGKSLLGNLADVLYLLHDTPFDVTDTEKANVYDWVYSAFVPLIWKHGEFMDMVRGREIARWGMTNTKAGAAAIGAMVRLSETAPAPHKARLQGLAKYWLSNVPQFWDAASISIAQSAKAIVRNNGIKALEQPPLNKVYAGMDRVVHRRMNWALGLAMNSTRQSYYETHTYNFENGKGWYTAEGATYLYSGERDAYGDAYWPTVNPHRLAGITENSAQQRADASGYSWNPLTFSNKSWVGGASDGEYGVAGMEQQAWGSSLTSKKSWFLFDDEVVCLGAGIICYEAGAVHTMVENRKLNAKGDNKLTVDGVKKDGAGHTVLANTHWMHLEGAVPGASVGYYFPASSTVETFREKRSGKWSAINKFNFPPGDPTFTNNFQEIWIDHGDRPQNAGYAYVLLPSKSAEEVKQYAAHPDIRLLQNSPAVQAVMDKSTGSIGANFWTDSLVTVFDASGKPLLSCNKKAAVLLRQVGDSVSLAIADPTQLNNGTIEIEFHRPASSVVATHNAIKVVQRSPTVKWQVQTAGTRGQSLRTTFLPSPKTTSAGVQ